MGCRKTHLIIPFIGRRRKTALQHFNFYTEINDKNSYRVLKEINCADIKQQSPCLCKTPATYSHRTGLWSEAKCTESIPQSNDRTVNNIPTFERSYKNIIVRFQRLLSPFPSRESHTAYLYNRHCTAICRISWAISLLTPSRVTTRIGTARIDRPPRVGQSTAAGLSRWRWGNSTTSPATGTAITSGRFPFQLLQQPWVFFD